MGLEITKILTEDMDNPLGLDCEKPQFAWILASDRENTFQEACRIRVFTEEVQMPVWDSGRMETDCSLGISYDGEKLAACTRYRVNVEVWDNYGRKAEQESWFETGFLCPDIEAWDGAEWISAPRFHVQADTRGVFVIESTFRMEKGTSRAGIVFGAEDYRLKSSHLNEYGLEGENYIRYELCIRQEEAYLDIYRAGYTEDDRADVPFASVFLRQYGVPDGPCLITEENRYEFHTLKIEVQGNSALAYIDGILVDAVPDQLLHTIAGRTLNPRGFNDVPTYPRINEIGFFAEEQGTAYFKDITVRNLREPGRVVIRETPGGNLYGEKSVFHGVLGESEDCFKVDGKQVTRDPSGGGMPMFRRSFVLKDEKIRSARLYITARGIYDCRVNGEEVTDVLLTPGLTQYDKRINYQTYDITDKLKSGENAVGVTLGSGWWCDAQTFVVKNYNYFWDKEALLAKICIRYENGETETIVTDTSAWKYSDQGPYRYGGLFQGEHFDAENLEIRDNYSRGDFDDSGWESPVTEKVGRISATRTMPEGFGRSWPEVNAAEPEFEGGYDAPVRIVKTRQAKERRQLEKNVWLYDFGQEMAGVPRIHVREERGTKLIFRYCEVLYPDMEEYRKNKEHPNAGRPMVENYRDASSTDIYICRGDKEGEVYQPKFTFHGFRYLEITGAENPPELTEVEALQYSSVEKLDGNFASSEPLLDRFAENVTWSQLCNFISIPTDCPQRNERMGWAGDTHVFCHTALQNSSLKKFYERNLQAMADLQTQEGRFPEIAPVGGGFGGITYECASIFMAWELYQQYGDIRTLERFYPGMEKYMAYMENKGLPGQGDPAKIGPLGDWLAPEETDLQLLWNAFYYREAETMRKIAAVLGKTGDQERYANLAEKCRKYWNETFVVPADGRTRGADGQICDSQCSYVIGLEYGLADDRIRAAEHLKRKTGELDYTVGTGFFGTGLLNQALTDTGNDADAYRLMLQTKCPSWLYPVTQGATTIWERWDSYTPEKGFGGNNSMNSFNHYSLGSVLSWMYSYILGIQRLEEYPGYSRFVLCPGIDGPLSEARGSVSTPYGPVQSGWKKEKDGVIYECEIPVNTRAMVKLPGREPEWIGSGKHEFRVEKGR
ncbi:MAG TPA: glycoside hydrolase family 78 protein [Candidatus Mediterraneibacter cottocaccae]|nr:glycoside hydrolase family 78 protein [Candidatus Mediterraneibacter cottocaccae]